MAGQNNKSASSEGMTRRSFLKTAAVGVAVLLAGAQGVFYVVKGVQSLLRPPGSQGEKDFLARCIKCGKCIEACPYSAIKVADGSTGVAAGTPVINPRDKACELCEDFPCVEACPTQALRGIRGVSDVNMGVARIDEEHCVAFKGMRCEVCYRSCPLIDEAITIDYRKLEGDDIHSVFAPQINSDKCVGCGICVERCPFSDPVVPICIVPSDEVGKNQRQGHGHVQKEDEAVGGNDGGYGYGANTYGLGTNIGK